MVLRRTERSMCINTPFESVLHSLLASIVQLLQVLWICAQQTAIFLRLGSQATQEFISGMRENESVFMKDVSGER